MSHALKFLNSKIIFNAFKNYLINLEIQINCKKFHPLTTFLIISLLKLNKRHKCRRSYFITIAPENVWQYKNLMTKNDIKVRAQVACCVPDCESDSI